MFELHVLQTQWLVMGLAGGLVVTLVLVMIYLVLWEPRRDQNASRPPSHAPAWIQWFADIPWVLIFAFTAAIVFTVAYLIDKSINPPNW